VDSITKEFNPKRFTLEEIVEYAVNDLGSFYTKEELKERIEFLTSKGFYDKTDDGFYTLTERGEELVNLAILDGLSKEELPDA
jgi:hypothetical protein